MSANSAIVVCGKTFDINTRVVLWNEKNGFNGYDTSKVITKYEDRKTGKIKTNIVSGKRYSSRTWKSLNFSGLTNQISQFFLHHSGLYRSRDTFNVLHNERGLSVHFILDDNGILYQTLDVLEKAWHGGKNNPISIGIEIDSKAQAGKFPNAYDEYHCKKYNVSSRSQTIDNIHGKWIYGFPYTDAQYSTLIKLAMKLVEIFPINIDFPRNVNNIVRSEILYPLEYNGFICHYNINIMKIDPICFDHYRFLEGVKNNNPYLKSMELSSPESIKNILQQLRYKSIEHLQKNNYLNPDGKWGPKTEFVAKLLLQGEKCRIL